MKVLLLHNFYQSSSPSGEDAVYNNEAEMLKGREVQVIQYEKYNDEIRGPLKAAPCAVWSRKTYHEISVLLGKERPDIAHFHNIWYLISPSAYHACKDAGVPVVQTLHNFRMFCANGLLMRNRKVCEECVGKMPWRGVIHGCYRDSTWRSMKSARSSRGRCACVVPACRLRREAAVDSRPASVRATTRRRSVVCPPVYKAAAQRSAGSRCHAALISLAPVA